MVEPVAETEQVIVTSVPISPDVRKPTCLYPFRANTPSSRFHVSFSWNLLRDRTELTFVVLKLSSRLGGSDRQIWVSLTSLDIYLMLSQYNRATWIQGLC